MAISVGDFTFIITVSLLEKKEKMKTEIVPFCFTGVCGNFKLALIQFNQRAEAIITIGANINGTGEEDRGEQLKYL